MVRDGNVFYLNPKKKLHKLKAMNNLYKQLEPFLVNNKVSPSFNTFSNITLFLILILIYFVYNNVMCDGPQCGDDTGKIEKVSNNILFFLSLLTMISTGVVYIILVFYRTDGFQVLNKDSEKIQFNYLL